MYAYGFSVCSINDPINNDRDIQRIGYNISIHQNTLVIQREIGSTLEHLVKVNQVLQQLKLVGFKANLRKNFFMQRSIKYIGYQ